ncbi:Orn/Lys/Arg decarboxylase [Haematococcus lacustris]
MPLVAHSWCHFMDCSPDKDLTPRACSAAGQARQTRPPELDNVAPREARVWPPPGLDYLASPTGVIAQAQAAAAAAYGAEQTWFLVNGCSVAIHAEVLAVAGPGDTLLLARNCHQAAYAAVTLAGCHPFWLYPELDPDFDLAHGISPTSRSQGLQQATYFALHIRGCSRPLTIPPRPPCT